MNLRAGIFTLKEKSEALYMMSYRDFLIPRRRISFPNDPFSMPNARKTSQIVG